MGLWDLNSIPRPSQVCFSSTEPFRFVVPQTGDYAAPPALSSFWIVKNFQRWEVGLGKGWPAGLAIYRRQNHCIMMYLTLFNAEVDSTSQYLAHFCTLPLVLSCSILLSPTVSEYLFSYALLCFLEHVEKYHENAHRTVTLVNAAPLSEQFHPCCIVAKN